MCKPRAPGRAPDEAGQVIAESPQSSEMQTQPSRPGSGTNAPRRGPADGSRSREWSSKPRPTPAGRSATRFVPRQAARGYRGTGYGAQRIWPCRIPNGLVRRSPTGTQFRESQRRSKGVILARLRPVDDRVGRIHQITGHTPRRLCSRRLDCPSGNPWSRTSRPVRCVPPPRARSREIPAAVVLFVQQFARIF